MFAAKTERTKMEDMPVETVPDVEAKDDFIIVSSDIELAAAAAPAEGRQPEASEPAAVKTACEEEKDEFDLSDIKTTPEKMSKEDIIAAAEAAAFGEK